MKLGKDVKHNYAEKSRKHRKNIISTSHRMAVAYICSISHY